MKARRGFTLIEMLIAIAIFAILLSFGLSSFQTMIASTKTKSIAESILGGLRKARTEAIKRNAPMRFQMVSTLDSSCVLSPTSSLWLVTQTDQGVGGGTYAHGVPTGKCDVAAEIPSDPCTAVCNGKPYIAFKSTSSPVSTMSLQGSDILNAAATTVTFGPLGQVLANIDGTGTLAKVDVTSTVADVKPWQVKITPSSGSLKLCDPTAAAVGTPLGC